MKISKNDEIEISEKIEEISEENLILRIREMISENEDRDNIFRFIFDSKLIKYDNIKLFLKKNNLDIKDRIDNQKYRNMIFNEFFENQKISKKELSSKLLDSNLKSSRISEYMNYYFDLFSKLSNLNSKKIQDLENQILELKK